MFNSTVNIIAFNTLYEILYEIKDVLKFEVKNYANPEKFILENKESKLNQLNFILISKSSNKNLFESKFVSTGKNW